MTEGELTPDLDVRCVLQSGRKVKVRRARMRACNEKNDKGKLCAGHLKRVFQIPLTAEREELKQMFGDAAELYRCERCRTFYLPHPGENAENATLSW
jgi:hypothetical protein